MDKIAIIILNYNSWEDTIQEIDICHDFLKFDYENIIVVDNASTNNSVEMLKKEAECRKFIFINANENRGYAAGNNIGMRYAYKHKYRYGLILNNDIVIRDENMIKKMLRIFSKDPSVAVVSPDIYAPNGYMYNRDSVRPSFFDYTLGIFLYKNKGRKVNNIGGYAYVYRPQGCCMMVDLEKMTCIDYMDEHTFLYLEEPILAERLMNKGYHCACAINTQVIHNHSVTVKSALSKKKRRKIVQDSFRYYLEQYRGFNLLKIKICLAVNNLKMIVMEK